MGNAESILSVLYMIPGVRVGLNGVHGMYFELKIMDDNASLVTPKCLPVRVARGCSSFQPNSLFRAPEMKLFQTVEAMVPASKHLKILQSASQSHQPIHLTPIRTIIVVEI